MYGVVLTVVESQSNSSLSAQGRKSFTEDGTEKKGECSQRREKKGQWEKIYM
ncbi:hypothetical protein GJ744_000311 [Endocarpon pusillum]|uniref:Uncharacterized protein n=1 Tax=Endocarpon pusillum TaxID=364733 RepID=A0A8H7AR06_9EURO|nr:hypothetical protein GJ744_000311 [Endocarpon pusillum]